MDKRIAAAGASPDPAPSDPAQPGADLRRLFGARLGHTARQWRRAVDERLGPFGLTDATWLSLVYLARNKAPMRQKDLAEAIGIDASSLVRLIDTLDRAGLVARQVDREDRRVKTVRLTPSGRAILARVDRVVEDIRNEVLAAMSDTQLAGALAVIEGVLAGVERVRHGERDEPAGEDS